MYSTFLRHKLPILESGMLAVVGLMNSASYTANVSIDFTHNTLGGCSAHTSLLRKLVGTYLSQRHQSLQVEQLENHFVSRSSYKWLCIHLKCCYSETIFMEKFINLLIWAGFRHQEAMCYDKHKEVSVDFFNIVGKDIIKHLRFSFK